MAVGRTCVWPRTVPRALQVRSHARLCDCCAIKRLGSQRQALLPYPLAPHSLFSPPPFSPPLSASPSRLWPPPPSQASVLSCGPSLLPRRRPRCHLRCRAARRPPTCQCRRRIGRIAEPQSASQRPPLRSAAPTRAASSSPVKKRGRATEAYCEQERRTVQGLEAMHTRARASLPHSEP